MPSQTVYFVHISDTHIGPTAGYSRHGHFPLPSARRLVELINDLPQTPDFVIHTGDVVADPDPAAYRLAAGVFGRLQVPIYYVVGNHDRARDVHHFLPMGRKEDTTTDRNVLSYWFEVKGYRFLTLHARGPVEIDPHGLFSPAQLDLVRREVVSAGPPLTIFTHFPVLPLDSIWMDANLLTLNGEQFHKIVREAGSRLRGVFHGHVHRPLQIWRDGVLYVSAGSAFSQFLAWPGDEKVGYDTEHRPAFGFVHLLPQQTVIHQHTFPRPNRSEP